MLPKLQVHFDNLERKRQLLFTELARLSEEQLRFQPAAGKWSLLEVVHHLLLVERMVVSSAADRPVRGRERRSLRARIGYAAVCMVLGLGVRVKVPLRSAVPETGASLGELEEEWDRTRVDLRCCLDGISERTMGHTLVRHPIGGPLNAVRTVSFLTRHFDHHGRQVKRIQRAAGFPQPS